MNSQSKKIFKLNKRQLIKIVKIKLDINTPIILFELTDSITGLSILLVNITPKIIKTKIPPTYITT